MKEGVEYNQPARASVHLRVGVATLSLAGVYVMAVLLFGWPIPFLLMPFMLLSLLLGGILVPAGLFRKGNRRGRRLWKHTGVLAAIAALLYLLSIGPGNYFALIDLRTRLAVMLTGGQGELQTWGLDLLGKSPEGMIEDGGNRRIPRELWSGQVRRLRPDSVAIAPVFQENRSGVCLNYGGGFFHWSIVVGTADAQPDPGLNYPDRDTDWIRWSDGLYDWQQY
jgi:hypothetical protein